MFNQEPRHIIQTNRLPLVLGVVLLAVVMGIFMVRTQMARPKTIVQRQPHQSMDIALKNGEGNWFNEEKFKNIKITGQEKARTPTARAMRQQAVTAQEMATQKEEIADAYAARLEIKKIEDKNLIEEKKMEMAALQSPLSIDIPGPPGAVTMPSAKPSAHNPLGNELNELMNMLQSTAGGKAPDLSSLAGGLPADNLDAKQAFLKKTNPDDDDYLKASKTKPRSAYEIKAGTYIPAALITGINADLPGSVNAQVTENVYDTISGNYLLIPQGTKLVGEYNSQVALGQSRVQVVWDRLIFPDGASLDIDKMQGVDISGNTGFHDKVDNHYLRIYGNAILLSLMGAGYDLLNNTQNTNGNGGLTAQQAIAANVGQKMSAVTDRTLEKNMDVQPTLMIDPGYKFKIFVLKDMVLEEIKNVEGTLAYAE